MSNTPKSYRSSFAGAAISTARSPLGKSFSGISCRSPETPRRLSRHAGWPDGLLVDAQSPRHGTYLTTPQTFAVTPTWRDSQVNTPNTFHDDDSRSGTTGTNDLFLPQTPQALQPSINGSYVNPEEGKLGTFSAINIILGKTVGVGVYSVPSSIFVGVGSVGASILMWVLGALISFCGCAVYLDLGTAIPRSGGERVYLERIFRKPKYLATCMFMAYVVLLGFSTPNCIVLGEYVLYALGITSNRWNVRSIAVGVITLVCWIHARYHKLGLRIINVLGVSKMLILVIVILAGAAATAMKVGSSSSFPVHDPNANLSTAQRNFSNLWAGSSTQPYDYATALLKVLYCFRGYSTANQITSSLSRPVHTLKLAAPIALSLVSLGYILVNISYFLAVEQDDFRDAGVVVAGHFFTNVFGEFVGERILPLFIIVSAFGNIAATSFAQARVNQELARDGMLPFSSFWAGKRTKKGGFGGTSGNGGREIDQTAARGLLLHWLVSVAVIVGPPPGEMYNFLVDIGGYPVSVISVAISAGLLYLQSCKAEKWESPAPARKFYTSVFLVANVGLLVVPWIEPEVEKGGVRYFAYPATALGILGSGAVYWMWWAKVKPWILRGRRGGGERVERGMVWARRSDESLAMRRLMRGAKVERQSLLQRVDGERCDDEVGEGECEKTSRRKAELCPCLGCEERRGILSR